MLQHAPLWPLAQCTGGSGAEQRSLLTCKIQVRRARMLVWLEGCRGSADHVFICPHTLWMRETCVGATDLFGAPCNCTSTQLLSGLYSGGCGSSVALVPGNRAQCSLCCPLHDPRLSMQGNCKGPPSVATAQKMNLPESTVAGMQDLKPSQCAHH